MIAEIAVSSRSIDLHAKRDDYARYGVREYLVLCPREEKLRWFDLRNDREVEPDDDGVYRIGVFPGLWIDSAALLARDHSRLMAVLQDGLDSTEHAEFVSRLAATRQS